MHCPRHHSWLSLAVALIGAARVHADVILLDISGAADDGLVVAHVDLTAAARWCRIAEIRPEAVRATVLPSGQPAPLQFIPDPDFDAAARAAGTVVLRLASGPNAQVRLELAEAPPSQPADWNGTVSTPSYAILHDGKRLSGMPSRIVFGAGAKTFENFRWQDRVHRADRGGFGIINDPNATVELVAQGPLCTAVRTAARFLRPDGTAPPSRPSAVYQWLYFHDRPLVHATVVQRQEQPFEWQEAHFLELNFPGKDFTQWAGGDPPEKGAFTASGKSMDFPTWAALVEGRHAIGALRSGQSIVYDCGDAYGSYLHAQGDAAWSRWADTERKLDAWLWIGTADDPAAAIQAAAGRLPTAGVTVTVDTVREQLAAATRQVHQAPPDERRHDWWQVMALRTLEAQGRFDLAVGVAAGKLPDAWTARAAGDLGMILEKGEEGIRLVGLLDVTTGRQLSAPKALPLFGLTLRRAGADETVVLDGDRGWNRVDVRAPSDDALELEWHRPRTGQLGDLAVVARATLDAKAGAIRWAFRVDNPGDAWSVWRVAFPQLSVADLGPDGEVLTPRGSGEVQRGVWQKAFRFKDHYPYPGGWSTMQFMAAYSPGHHTGLYFATHDPLGSVKDILVESRPGERALEFVVDNPAAQMGIAGNDFALSGQAVWQLLRGDWFDAAMIYRDWARAEARWFPQLGPDGREDTPLWMRELPAWAMGGGEPAAWAKAVREFQQFMGVPVGVHWYDWHQIPFDNDYPHYLPADPGFAEAVRALQDGPVYVMPYINGRLWDIRDKGMEDWEFTRVARPAATKDDRGEPIVESYGSKEPDGSPVRLAVMCPSTQLWQDRLKGLVLQLFGECGVKGVYMDQIAAAGPVLCFDPAHGHPLGGGSWWTGSYWKLLDAIRAAKPADRMLTSECNAEPFVRWFDGYLTWHWQSNGQVPAFPAIYGGAIQMFGRAYRGGETKDLALRMKAGQQLVFGEQIGWLGPEVIHEPDNAAFLRQIVRLRWALRRYFYAGEMARPPQLAGQLPRVTADWQWAGKWPVTTDAVLTGAWRLPAENKLVLLMVNVGDQPVQSHLKLNLRDYGFTAAELRLTRLAAEGAGEQGSTPSTVDQPLVIPPRTAWAWEITPP